jgi:Tol biopolymer transport system component
LGETKTWSLDWTPDSPPGDFTPQPLASDACLTLATVQQALTSPQPLPATLTGKLIVYGRIVEDKQNPSPENYGVFVVRLNGRDQKVLGPGVWPALSPDGTKAAYAWDEGLYVTDLASGQSYHIPGTNANDYNPRWSPDGSRIAFVRVDDVNLYIIRPDGSGLQMVTDANDYEQLIGWSADGESLYFGALAQDGYLLKKTNLSTGAVQDLFSINSKGLSVAISPDEKWIAFFAQSAETSRHGLSISRVDGSERRLLAQLDRWDISNPIWSPDGQWLLFAVINWDQTPLEEIPVVLNVDTCTIFPLPIRGSVFGWEE